MKVISEKASKNRYPGRQMLLKMHFHIKMHSFLYVCEQCNVQLPGALFGLSPQNFLPKKIYTCPEKFSYICSKKAFQIFRKRELSYFFLKKRFFIFRERYIQNPAIFRSKSISRTRGKFRTLSNIYDGMFCKNSYLAHF